MKLNGKVVLITGAGRGIGQSIAILFAQEGAKVAVNDKDDSSEQTVKTIKTAGNEAIVVKADVSKAVEVQRMVNNVIDKYGKIDVLVNNAGIELHAVKTLMDTSEEQWDHTLDTNLKGYFLVSKYVAPHMIKNGGGIIINISSVDGLYAFCNSHISYNTSQAGRNMLTKVMARQLGPHNIRVNAICPTSTYDTGLYQITPEKEVKMKAENPLGRSANKEEVAKLALFLASNEVPYMNGELMVLDGGHTI